MTTGTMQMYVRACGVGERVRVYVAEVCVCALASACVRAGGRESTAITPRTHDHSETLARR